jgi:hypothetical protein
MPGIFLAFVIFVSPIVAAVLLPASAAAASPGPLHPGCWGLFGPDEEVAVNNADEVLCVDQSGRASIRESSMYGEGVKGCNVVTIRSQGNRVVIDINYRRCANNAPSHTLTCGSPSARGIYSCTLIFPESTHKEDKEGMPVKLAPLPAGQ